jgi:hypothetical protein
MDRRIGSDDAAAIRTLLVSIGSESATSPSIRHAAQAWSDDIGSDLEWRDLRTVAGLLQDASDDQCLPADRRGAARYWCAFLTHRLRQWASQVAVDLPAE